MAAISHQSGTVIIGVFSNRGGREWLRCHASSVRLWSEIGTEERGRHFTSVVAGLRTLGQAYSKHQHSILNGEMSFNIEAVVRDAGGDGLLYILEAVECSPTVLLSLKSSAAARLLFVARQSLRFNSLRRSPADHVS